MFGSSLPNLWSRQTTAYSGRGADVVMQSPGRPLKSRPNQFNGIQYRDGVLQPYLTGNRNSSSRLIACIFFVCNRVFSENRARVRSPKIIAVLVEFHLT